MRKDRCGVTDFISNSAWAGVSIKEFTVIIHMHTNQRNKSYIIHYKGENAKDR